MSKVEIQLNNKGIQDMLKSPKMKEYLEQLGNKAMGQLGTGYEMSTVTGKTRANVQINADTFQTRKDNLRNNTLLKVVKGL